MQKPFKKISPGEIHALEVSEKILEQKGKLPSFGISNNGLKRGLIPVSDEDVENVQQMQDAEFLMNCLQNETAVRPSGFINGDGYQRFYVPNYNTTISLKVCDEIITEEVEETYEFSVAVGDEVEILDSSTQTIECTNDQKIAQVESGQLKKFTEDNSFIKQEGTQISFLQDDIKINLLDTYQNYSDDGKRQETIYIFEIFNKNRREEISVCAEKLQQLDWLQKASEGLLYLKSNDVERVKKMLISTIREANITPKIKYDTGGWKNVNDKYIYVLANGIVGNDNFPVIGNKKYIFPPRKKEIEYEIFNHMLDMFSLCKNPAVINTLILYVQMSFLSTLFSLAGATIKFIVTLIGETNSRKTSLALLLAKVFVSKEKQPDATFAATLGGIEKAIYNCCDCCMVLDDIKPGTTKAQNKEIEEKLELITRIQGDKTPKKRMIGYGSDMSDSVGGGCIVTGEYINGVESSRTRRVDIFIDRNEVNNERLTFFQNTNFWANYLYNFIAYVTDYVPQIINEIKSDFTTFRNQNKFQINRRNDQYAQFCISAKLMLYYGVYCRAITEEEKNQLYKQIENWICQVLENNEKETEAVSSFTIMLKSLCNYVPEYAEPIGFYDKDAKKIYQNKEYFFISIEKLLEIATQYAKNIGASIEFPGERMIPKLLEQENLILVKKEGENIRRTLHLPNYTTGNRFLWISKEKLEKWLQKIETKNC